MSASEITRRDLLKRSSLLAVPALLGAEAAEAAAAAASKAAVPATNPGAAVYASIGVRPLINARGTYTIISGSRMLPEVRAAMDAAARHYVHLDELADAIGARLAELTKAEWGLVTSGCAAALTHATAACVAGGNPDLHVRIPDLRGFPRDEAIIPKHSRNVYDAAVRAVGVRVVEVSTVAELEAAFGPRTALVYILAGPEAEAGPLTTRVLCDAAKAKGVPVLVDAAAEVLTVPNVHLEAGATLVAYSGGKCLRGPQTGGMLLGRKDLVRAAWVHSAPHHGFARAMKVGKEEAIGMLTAVEMWMKRDHAAEWAQWMSWLDAVAKRVSSLTGVRTVVVQPEGLSNKTPSLHVLWDPETIRHHRPPRGPALVRHRPAGRGLPREGQGRGGDGPLRDPLHAGRGRGEDRGRSHLRAAQGPSAGGRDRRPRAPAADLTGQWDVRIEYAAGTSSHTPAPDAEGEPPLGFASGGLRVARPERHDRRGRGAHRERLRGVARRRAQLHVLRQGHGRRDLGQPRDGRVSQRALFGEEEGPWQGVVGRGLASLWPAGLVLLGFSGPSFAAPKYDLLLRGGTVLDARNGVNAVRDVAIAAGRIAAIAERIDPAEALKTVEVRGLYVTPGLVDIHAHVFTGTGEKGSYAGDNSVYPDGFTLRVGVTTVADAGGAGWRNFDTFKERVIDRSKTRVLAFLNIVGNGMRGAAYEQVLADMEAGPTAEMALRHKGLIVGIKTAHYEGPEWAPVERAVEAGTRAGIPVMVDFGKSLPERPLAELVTRKLRPGDIYTHVYSGLARRAGPFGPRQSRASSKAGSAG